MQWISRQIILLITTLGKATTPKTLLLIRLPQAHSTDAPPSSSCPPRRWSGAGVSVGMVRVLGIPSLEIFRFAIFIFSMFKWSSFQICDFQIYIFHFHLQFHNVSLCKFLTCKYQKSFSKFQIDQSSTCQNFKFPKYQIVMNADLPFFRI